MDNKDIKKLERILKTIEKTINRCEKETLESFLLDDTLSDACAMRLLVIGESANDLSDDCQKRHPQVDWVEIYGLRNRIAHDYSGIDFEILWDIIQNDLPVLKSQIAEIFAYEKNNPK